MSEIKQTKPARQKPPQKNMEPPQKLLLMITIVGTGKGVLFTDLLEGYGVNMQLLLHGRGSAASELGQYLGAGQDKEIVLSVISEEKAGAAMKAINEKFASARGAAGVSMTVPFSSMIGVFLYGFLSNSRELIRSNENGK